MSVKPKPKVKIDEEYCKGCGLCVPVCPKDILRLSADRINSKGYFPSECIDLDSCIGCTFCAVMCPDMAIEVV